MKSTVYEVESTNLKTPRRRRTEKDAVAYLDGHIRLPPYERRSALNRIRDSRQPGREAKRIVDHTRQRGINIPDDGIDCSDVQELRTKLIRRDGGAWEPQASLLHEMDTRIASGEMDPNGFKERTAVVLGNPGANFGSGMGIAMSGSGTITW